MVVGTIMTFRVAQGKMSQAKEWTDKMIEYLAKANHGHPRYILQPLTGESNELSYVAVSPSMTFIEEAKEKRDGDAEWEAIAKTFDEWCLGYKRRMFDVIKQGR